MAAAGLPREDASGPASGGDSVNGIDKRRLARIPVQCSVAVREKLTTWATQTEDVGARGCRIKLTRSLSPGALLQLALGDGPDPLAVLGQVAWVSRAPPFSAGITFLSAPRQSRAVPGDWIDRLAAAQLRRALTPGADASAAVGNLSRVPLRLGTPPPPSASPVELEIVAVARCDGPISAVGSAADRIRALAALLERGTVTLGALPTGRPTTHSSMSIAMPATEPPKQVAAGMRKAGTVGRIIVPPTT